MDLVVLFEKIFWGKTVSEIFISYDHEDVELTQKIEKFLHKKDINIKSDNSLIVGGNVYDFVNSAVSECKGFILIISPAYLNNRRYARTELKEIITRSIYSDIRIIPIITDRSISTTHLPFGLASINYYYIDSENFETVLTTISEEIKDIIPGSFYEDQNDFKTWFPSERRIRIQASVVCSQKCEGCHWDDFPRNNNSDDDEIIYEVSSSVKVIMEKLKLAESSTQFYPRPNIEFALTGGEPLYNNSEEIGWKDLARIYPKKTFLITNGRFIDNQLLPYLREQMQIGNLEPLKAIRIHYPYVNGSREYVSVDNENITIYIKKVRHNIELLIDFLIRHKQEIKSIDIRFNRMFNGMRDNIDLENLDNYISGIERTFENGIRNGIIRGIALIEPFPKKNINFDIFKLAEDYKILNAIPSFDPDETYRKKSLTINKLKIEFIKLNCGITDDIVGRCFNCVKDQDISICADGRIKICTGYNDKLRPQYSYTHFNSNQPLIGIAGAIKRKYGFIGFYNIFSKIINYLRTEKIEMTIPVFYSGRIRFTNSILFDEKNNGLQEITNAILKGNINYCKLYEEGLHPEKEHYSSIIFCTQLGWVAYRLLKKIINTKESEKKKILFQKMNAALLLLAYFSVDEDLFSTARTKIVQGMLPILLKRFSEIPTGELNSEFIEYSSYYLGTLLFENSALDDVEFYLNNEILKSAIKLNEAVGISYLLGCISRQRIKEFGDIECNNALKYFELAFENANKKIEHDDEYEWFYREILVEARRSSATIMKKSNDKKIIEESEEEFRQANYLANIYQTKLRYHALFSDGYKALVHYFKTEYNKDTLPINGWDGHKKLSESVTLNSDFYASLIRLGLLNIALMNIHLARENLKLSNLFFEKRGLLTDQEYLNSILSELLLWSVSIDPRNPPRIDENQILASRKIGPRDIKCVNDDAKFFGMILENPKFKSYIKKKSPRDIKKIKRILDDYIKFTDNLYQLLQSKK
ncbi:MAG: toll/interleukin-1 receptor domain-containing protein [Ignavibacteria bacterium]|jgi:hypothetical protein